MLFCLKYSVPEAKLTLLLFYYAINYLVYLIALIVYLYVIIDPGLNSYFTYAVCSVGGYKEECEIYKERTYDSYIPSTVMSMVSVILFSMINFVHLIYVVHIPTAKKTIKDTLKSWHCTK